MLSWMSSSNRIQRFPYSRHSSYSELCELVAAFHPRDIHPCTVDPSSWNEDVSIQRLFGHLCSGRDFAHDVYMRETLEDTDDENNQPARKRARYDESSSTRSTQDSSLAEDGHAMLSLAEYQPPNPQAQASGLPIPGNESRKPVDGHSTDPPSPQSLPTPKDQSELTCTKQPACIVNQVKAKRDQVRRAHQYLQEHADPNLIRIGPLPPWPEDENPSHNEETIKKPTHEHSDEIPQTHEPNNPPSPQTHAPQQQDSQLTDTTTLSIPESALLISPPPREEHARNTSGQHNSSSSSSSEPDLHERQSMRNRITARTRARIAAYLAAQGDSWVDMSLTSAGNNHAEEEVEL